MCKSQSGKTLVFVSELGQLRQNIDQFAANKPERFSHDDDIRVVSDIAACRAEVDDPLRLGALQSVCVDMAHYIMADHFLSGFGFFIVNIIRMGFEFGDLLVGDGQSQFLLRLSQRDPQFPPGPEFHIRRKDVLHLFARISLGERAHISVIGHFRFPF